MRFKISFLLFLSNCGALPAEMVLKSSPFQKLRPAWLFFPLSLAAKCQKTARRAAGWSCWECQHFSGRSFAEERSHGRIPLLLPELLAPFQQVALGLSDLFVLQKQRGGEVGKNILWVSANAGYGRAFSQHFIFGA